MGRPKGSIDRDKQAAILEAAILVLSEQGARASLEDIAQRAGVSKQTLYNHYSAKQKLVEVLVQGHQVEVQTSLLWPDPFSPPEETLAQYARVLLSQISQPSYRRALQALVRALRDAPEQAQRLHRATLYPSIARLAQFLAVETARGRLAVDNPQAAAELFLDLVIARPQLMILKGIAQAPEMAAIERTARRAAQVFTQGYAVSCACGGDDQDIKRSPPRGAGAKRGATLAAEPKGSVGL